MPKMHENSVYIYSQKIDTRHMYAIVARYIFTRPKAVKKILDERSSDTSRVSSRDICSSYLLAEPVPATTRWMLIVVLRRRCLVPYELELTLPQVVLEASAGSGGRPLPGKGRADVAIARIDSLLAKVQLHRDGGVSRVDPVIASRHRLYRKRTSSSPRGLLLVAAVVVVVAVVVAVTFVATRDRAAIIRIEDAYFGLPSARETRALQRTATSYAVSTRQEYIPCPSTFVRVRTFLSLSLSFSLSLYLIAHRRPGVWGVVTIEAICVLHTTCRLTPRS